MKRQMPTTRCFQLMHITIKATGKGHKSDQWIFNNHSKRDLIDQMKRFLKLYKGIKLIGFCCLSNHLHAILRIMPECNYSRSEVAQLYHECYPKQKIHPNSSACQKLQKELNNISKFMYRFERDFACRFNARQKFKRTGHLWQGPFHNTNLNDVTALLRCWVYVMFNPTKANMIQNPVDYKFSSINCHDGELMEEAMNNFFELYKFLTEDESLTLESFQVMLNRLLERELEEWLEKNETEREEYRQTHHIWDRAHYIDKSYFDH